MLNPSTADANAPDATITRCIGFARSWGYDGLHVVNLFAWRATNPESLYEHMALDIVGPDNDVAILAAPRKLVVCAWGNDGGLRNRAGEVFKMLFNAGANLRAFGMTKSGHPKHPLYLSANSEPIFKMEGRV